nr:hypothetical protein [Tanacetum cinerariifolium]
MFVITWSYKMVRIRYSFPSSSQNRRDLHRDIQLVNVEVHSKPLPLIEDQGRQVVLVNYFFNKDLEYLKGGSSSGKYTNSTTKTKAAKYDSIEGIEDVVQTLWSPVKVAYDKHAI